MKMNEYKTTDEYIANFPADIQAILQKVRATIKHAAPEASEKISYGIPTFTQNGNLVHFAGYDSHIGFYPGPGALDAFKDELTPYETSKGTIRFPLDKPIPYDLIEKITHFRVDQNQKSTK